MSVKGTLLGDLDAQGTLRGYLYAPTYVSAYQIAVNNGFKGSEEEWVASLKGATGESAYDLARKLGFEGSEEQWIESLHGKDGKSAYELAVDAGFQGTLEDWLEALLSGTGSGTLYHRDLLGRDEADQHPIDAITNLPSTLTKKADLEDVPDVLVATSADIREAFDAWVKVVDTKESE